MCRGGEKHCRHFAAESAEGLKPLRAHSSTLEHTRARARALWSLLVLQPLRRLAQTQGASQDSRAYNKLRSQAGAPISNPEPDLGQKFRGGFLDHLP
jgi:hypothetical protein